MPETPPKPDQPKRLTLSQIIELMLTRSAARQSTVGISRNGKGEVSIEVKVGTMDEGAIVTVEDAERKAAEVYERLHAAYAPSSGHEDAQVELTRNAKGETQVSVEVKTTAGGIETAQAAAETARTLYEQTRERFPWSS